MLPSALQYLRSSLQHKDYRSSWEESLLNELAQIEIVLEVIKQDQSSLIGNHALHRHLTSLISGHDKLAMIGPPPGQCPVCGK